MLGLVAFRSFFCFQDGIFVDHLDQVPHHLTRARLFGRRFVRFPALDAANGAGTSEEWVVLEVSGCGVFAFRLD